MRESGIMVLTMLGDGIIAISGLLSAELFRFFDLAVAVRR